MRVLWVHSRRIRDGRRVRIRSHDFAISTLHGSSLTMFVARLERPALVDGGRSVRLSV
jgi:hypothetical protein